MMSHLKPLRIDLAEAGSTGQLMPRAPWLSSQRSHWQTIQLQSHRQPRWEIPEIVYQQHAIVIHNSESMAQTERKLDGRRQDEQIGYGNVAIVPAHVSHQVSWDRDADFMLLSLEPDRLAQIAYESIDLDRAELAPSFAQPDPLVHQIGHLLQTELQSNGLGGRLFVDSLVTALGIHLLRNYAVRRQPITNQTDGLSQYQLQLAIDYIHAHLGEDLSLEAIAVEVGMSQYYFSRLFKQSVGLAPYQYVIQQRVERAKQLLKQQEISISDIALQCGFASQSHLNLHFKRWAGATPREFRNQ
jgi:AraC family transcriptional regulator